MRKLITGVLLLILSGVGCAEMVMQIDLNGELDKVKLSTLSKVVFDGNSMIAGSTYDLDYVTKITFYDDDISPIVQKGEQLAPNKIGFLLNASNLTLSVPEDLSMKVSLFSVSGRQIAELHEGAVQAGSVKLSLDQYNLATGIYSVVVQANNQLFVRKIVIK